MLKHFLTIEEGLSHNEVTAIVQDNDGFIWIGTRGGLNRYDGYNFKIFNQIPGDSNSLVNPSIESLFVDRKGNIWIGTKSGGVSKYNPATGVFKNLASNYLENNNILPDNRVLSFFEDTLGQIWMGTWENGLIIYNEKENTSKHFLGHSRVNSIVETFAGKIWVGSTNGLYEYNEDNETFSLQGTPDNLISCKELQYDDRRNVLWIATGTNSGIIRFDLRNNKLIHYKIGKSNSNNINTVHAYQSVHVDNSGRVWVGTWGTGFYSFDPEKEQFNRFLIYPDNRAAFNKDYDAVLKVFQDRDKNLWLGTNGGGVCILTPRLGFNSIGFCPNPNKGLVNTRIMSVIESSDKKLWLGTIGSGLFWSPDRENIFHVPNPDKIDNSRFFIIKNLFEDVSGRVWVGTNADVYFVKMIGQKPQLINAGDKYRNANFYIQAVSFLDAGNMLWVGTLQHGLFLFDKNNNYTTLKNYVKTDSLSGNLNSNRISFLLQDSKERIWIGTYNGLHIFNWKDSTICVAEKYFKTTGKFTGNIVTCIDEDQKGNIWVGTPSGLNKLTETGERKFTIEYYTEKDGLASNFIKGIAHDLNGNIWFSTNVGISKFVPAERRFVNFDSTDGVKGRNFTEAAVFRNKKGEIFFGGNFGLTYFSSEKIVENPLAPKPVLTGLSVLNQPVEPGRPVGSSIILEKAIFKTPEIKLSYRQNNFEIDFSSLDYKSMGRSQYKYLLENHDENWNYIGRRRFVNFNNLKPGTYILKVKSANSHSVWNENESQIKITVEPPFWQTWYALLFYILMVIGIVSIIRWNAVKQVRLANNLELEKLQHEQDQKLSEMKFRFFINISHEFRTPLTLILAPLKELISKKEKFLLTNEVENKIIIAQNNSLRLMKLVNQLLDFRKMETGKMKLYAQSGNLEEFVTEVCLPFNELAQINNINFKFNSALETKEIWFDRDKLEIILNNLISNAFKFLKENGNIEVALFEEEDEVLLSVSDNGPGIPSSEIKYIFDRFYRIGKNQKQGSTGIGLNLTKRFVELHHGTISVVSNPAVHTEFVVSLPKGDKHLSPEEKGETVEKEARFIRMEQVFNSVLQGRSKAISKSGECILIVEDDAEIREYIAGLLGALYCVESASNGAEGVTKVTEQTPDLIISDVMMPVMDGFEFCEKIRSSEATSTIPFIFLTAKSDEQVRLLSAQIGVDDFISKPFDPDLLIEKVKNILTSRKMLQKKYSKSVRLEPSDIEITSGEEIFIEKTISIIEDNLQNSKFSSSDLASGLNMSSSSLYRKLKGLTDSSTAEFIRSIRIKRAAQLLADREKTITEIAYEVGFNDVKHFRTVFQKQFGCAPTEYRGKL